MLHTEHGTPVPQPSELEQSWSYGVRHQLDAKGWRLDDDVSKILALLDETLATVDAANAPAPVNNFVYLARAGSDDGLLVNRSVRDFVIQTGRPDNTTSGDAGSRIPVEPPSGDCAVGWWRGEGESATPTTPRDHSSS